MSEEPLKDNEGNTAAHYWAKGGMWFLIWLGFGGCVMMANRGSGPSLQITSEASAKP